MIRLDEFSNQFAALFDQLYNDPAFHLIEVYRRAEKSRVPNHWYKKAQQIFDFYQLWRYKRFGGDQSDSALERLVPHEVSFLGTNAQKFVNKSLVTTCKI